MKNLKILITLDERLYQTLIKMKDIGLGTYNEAIINGTVVPDDCEIQSKSSDLHTNIPDCKDAISETIVETLENLLAECGDMGHFCINGNDYQLTQLITELKNGTEAGKEFQKNVCSLVVTYLMKFGGEE